jgi:hypothetical protein
MQPSEPLKKTAIRDLYPDLSEEQLKEAEENLRRYAELGLRILEATRPVPCVLDRPQALAKMEERSNNSLKI